uniref:Uncharacterized protein n=1 Tax=Anopheles albimanus TaxID=7167 RepID=A0A182FZ04_ANOAL
SVCNCRCNDRTGRSLLNFRHSRSAIVASPGLIVSGRCLHLRSLKYLQQEAVECFAGLLIGIPPIRCIGHRLRSSVSIRRWHRLTASVDRVSATLLPGWHSIVGVVSGSLPSVPALQRVLIGVPV